MKQVTEHFGVTKQEVKDAMSAYDDYISNKEFIEAMQNNELVEQQQHSTQSVEVEEEELTATDNELDVTDALESLVPFPVVDRRPKRKSREELLSSAREQAHQINNNREDEELKAKIKHNFGR
jgi:hypothetical protein